ncbi:MAG: DUF2141 domain-containing protein [Cyclobacteriaceae bacterium]|nr:DUF2141 domain-containing protein [Cyclobacteriaceae bacterium]
MKKSTIIVAIAILLSVQGFAQVKLTVNVKNIQSSEGKILVGLFNSEETFLEKAYQKTSANAKEGHMQFEFDNVPEGTYTISVIHDKNNNGSLDKNMIGIPTEPYGISMDGKSMFGPPSYEDAVFKVTDKNLTLHISL